jgi:hypothetical protein
VKTLTWNRLAKLEARRFHRGANHSDSIQSNFKLAVMLIVSFHVGVLTTEDSFATALARGLCISGISLKSALGPDNHNRSDVWALVLDKLNDLLVARGCRPIFDDGTFTVEGSRDDDRLDGLDVLDQLYDEIPGTVKERYCILPCLAAYFA